VTIRRAALRGIFAAPLRRRLARIPPAPAHKLELLFVGPLPPHRGGAGVFWGEVLPALARRGHRIHAIAPIDAERSRSPDGFAIANPGLTLERFELPYLVSAPDSPQPAGYRELEGEEIARRVARRLADRAPDVLIAGREAVAPHLAAFDGVPRALVVHGTTMYGVARGSYGTRLARELLAAIRGFDLVLTSARHQQESLARHGVGTARVIRNPVDLARFHPGGARDPARRALRAAPHDVVVLHASKLTGQKRPLDIVAAATIALAAEPRLLFVIAGDGALRDGTQQAVREHGLDERFRFPGWVEHARVAELLAAADMVVMPSDYECQALVYLEAMACALPLIASDIPAAREVLLDGVSGLLHPVGDTDALARAILRVTRSPAMAARLGSAALASVRPHELGAVAALYERELLALTRPAALAASSG